MEIKLSRLSKSFKEGGKTRMILNDVSTVFPAERFSVILGKSGSGKSTLLNLISGIDIPDNGTIHIGNADLMSMSDHRRTLFRRSRIGFVFQFFNLIPTLTVLENVMLISELSGNGKNQKKDEAIQILTKVGLEDRCFAFPDTLSGGEQQRTAIARSVLHNPDLILADEPTGNLDHDTGTSVLKLLLELTREKNKTLIMATHSDEVKEQADHIFTINKGQLLQLR